LHIGTWANPFEKVCWQQCSSRKNSKCIDRIIT
jgi:hypothetical protein